LHRTNGAFVKGRKAAAEQATCPGALRSVPHTSRTPISLLRSFVNRSGQPEPFR
jgi:hypothetical protein